MRGLADGLWLFCIASIVPATLAFSPGTDPLVVINALSLSTAAPPRRQSVGWP